MYRNQPRKGRQNFACCLQSQGSNYIRRSVETYMRKLIYCLVLLLVILSNPTFSQVKPVTDYINEVKSLPIAPTLRPQTITSIGTTKAFCANGSVLLKSTRLRDRSGSAPNTSKDYYENISSTIFTMIQPAT